MFQTKMMGGGHFSWLQALTVAGTVDPNVTALGSSQSTAYAVIHDRTYVTTTAASTGVVLPADQSNGGFATQGDACVVSNQGANALSVYPPSGGYINSAAQNTAVSLAAGQVGIFFYDNASTATTPKWSAIYAA